MKAKKTYQRQVLLEELRKVTSHPTAEELYELVREKLPGIGIATVYRNLERMARENMVLKLEGTGKKNRFDGNVNPHHHLRCLTCSKVIDLNSEGLEDLDKSLSNLKGKKGIVNYSIEFQGMCDNCQN